MSVEEFDKEALALMTPEERAAIEDTEFSPEELAAMKAVAGEGEPGADDDDDDDESTPAVAATAKPAGESKADAGDSGKTGAAEETPAQVEDEGGNAAEGDKGEQFRPRYQAPLPEDYAEKVAALKDDARVLAQKFKDGEIEFDDFQEQTEALNSRRDELAEIRVKASIAEDMNSQTVEQRWQFTIDRFAAAVARDEKIDYKTDLEKQADLDSFVKTLAANPKNKDKDFDWFLAEGHKRVKALHGIVDSTAAAEKKVEKPARKPPAAPQTLAQVPGSDGVGDVGGEFADLDALEGIDLEQAIAKMTPAQRERYVRGD